MHGTPSIIGRGIGRLGRHGGELGRGLLGKLGLGWNEGPGFRERLDEEVLLGMIHGPRRDVTNCQVALSVVRSFGNEDRGVS